MQAFSVETCGSSVSTKLLDKVNIRLTRCEAILLSYLHFSSWKTRTKNRQGSRLVLWEEQYWGSCYSLKCRPLSLPNRDDQGRLATSPIQENWYIGAADCQHFSILSYYVGWALHSLICLLFPLNFTLLKRKLTGCLAPRWRWWCRPAWSTWLSSTRCWWSRSSNCSRVSGLAATFFFVLLICFCFRELLKGFGSLIYLLVYCLLSFKGKRADWRTTTIYYFSVYLSPSWFNFFSYSLQYYPHF